VENFQKINFSTQKYKHLKKETIFLDSTLNFRLENSISCHISQNMRSTLLFDIQNELYVRKYETYINRCLLKKIGNHGNTF
jgi:hypothetical protein